MTITEIGSLGELLAAIATLAGLVYLAVQIRQNSRMLGEQAKRFTQQVVHDQNLLLVQDDPAFAIVSRGMAGEELTAAERARFHIYWMSAFINYQETFYQVRQLGVDDDWWRIVERHLLRVLETPGLAGWWDHNRSSFGDDFVAFVEEHRSRNLEDRNQPGL